MPTSTTPAAIPSLRHTATIDGISSAIDEFGAVIVSDLVDADLVARLRSDLAPWIARTPPGSRSDDPEWQEFHGSRTVRFNGLAAKTPAFVDICLEPTILGVADRRLIPGGGSTQISGTQVISIGPGEDAQYLHRDQTLWPWFNRDLPDGPEVTVLAMLALTEVTEANGATRIVPYSHQRADSPELFDPAVHGARRDVRQDRPSSSAGRRSTAAARTPRLTPGAPASTWATCLGGSDPKKHTRSRSRQRSLLSFHAEPRSCSASPSTTQHPTMEDDSGLSTSKTRRCSSNAKI